MGERHDPACTPLTTVKAHVTVRLRPGSLQVRECMSHHGVPDMGSGLNEAKGQGQSKPACFGYRLRRPCLMAAYSSSADPGRVVWVARMARCTPMMVPDGVCCRGKHDGTSAQQCIPITFISTLSRLNYHTAIANVSVQKRALEARLNLPP